MREQLMERLQSLKAEFESGQQMLADLESRQTQLRETMLRISGAIQVLEEELNRPGDQDHLSSREVADGADEHTVLMQSS